MRKDNRLSKTERYRLYFPISFLYLICFVVHFRCGPVIIRFSWIWESASLLAIPSLRSLAYRFVQVHLNSPSPSGLLFLLIFRTRSWPFKGPPSRVSRQLRSPRGCHCFSPTICGTLLSTPAEAYPVGVRSLSLSGFFSSLSRSGATSFFISPVKTCSTSGFLAFVSFVADLFILFF